MSVFRFTALAVVSSAGLGLASAALANPYQDDVAIEGVVYYPDDDTSHYTLAGQSAYLQERAFGGTSGGQLDGIQSNGGFGVYYAEVFPEANLTDYLTFGYFGIVETYSDTGDAPRAIELTDTSFVMALTPGIGVGGKVEDFNTPGYDEATVVAALTGSFDSPEFFDLLNSWSDQSDHFGAIALPQEGITGDTLDLIAFIGGPDGDEGVKIGELNTRITRNLIPAPGATALFGLAGIAAIRRRR